MDINEHYRRVADSFGHIVAGVGDWTATTPCEQWDARALTTHVVDTHRRVLGRLPGNPPEPPVLAADADLAHAWAAVRTSLETALASDEATEVESFGGPAPFGRVVDTLLCADTLLHTWDLARASDQDDTLDLACVASAQSFLTPMGDMMRMPGGFGAAVTVADDASAQDRLVGFSGRNPAPSLT